MAGRATKCLIRQGRRGGRVAEGGGLLNRYTVINRIVGSNPIPSAIHEPLILLISDT
jgi:hypothetical protein